MTKEDYSDIDIWTKALLKEKLEELEPVVKKIKERLRKMEGEGGLYISSGTAHTFTFNPVIINE